MITIHSCVNMFENKLRPIGSKASELAAEIDRTLGGLKHLSQTKFEYCKNAQGANVKG
jgi:hypothetical protein